MEDIIPRWLESLGILLGGIAALIGVSIPLIKVLKLKRPQEPEKVDVSIDLELGKHFKKHLETLWQVLVVSSIMGVLAFAYAPVAGMHPDATDIEKKYFPLFFGVSAVFCGCAGFWAFIKIHFTEGKLINILAGQKIAMEERVKWFKKK